MKLLRAGIVPIHPTMNFIPRDPPAGEALPAGTFLELKVMNFSRLFDYVEELPLPKRKRMMERVDKLIVYNDLNMVYDYLFTQILLQQKDRFIDAESETYLYEILEKVLAAAADDKTLQEFRRRRNTATRLVTDVIKQATTKPEFTNGLHQVAQGLG